MKKEIIEELKEIVGDKAVLTDAAGRLAYSFDSALDRGMPDAVVIPTAAEQVAPIVALAAREGIPFIARGSGTNLCGGTIASRGGITVELSKLEKILEIDPTKGYCVAEPGVINHRLQRALEPHGYFFAPDPASYKISTIGGNVANNSGGPHCVKYGVTTHHVLGLDMVLPDGKAVRVDRSEQGYDFTGLFVGSEGTLGVATRMRLKILPKPEAVKTMLAVFGGLEPCLSAVVAIVSAGILPSTLEVMDKITLEAVEAFLHSGYPKGAEAVLLAEVDGRAADLEAQTARITEICRASGALSFQTARTEEERTKLWEGRRGSYPAMARLAPNVLVEDGAVPRSRLVAAFRKIQAIGEREKLRVSLICHAGDGNLHPQIVFDERNPEETKTVKRAGMEMLKACIEEGGTISGEHGIGTDKLEAMKWLFSKPTLELFHRIKGQFDPQGIANPGKLIPDVKGLVSSSPTPLQGEGVEEIVAVLKKAQFEKTPVVVTGMGTKYRPEPGHGVVLKTTGLKKVLDHDLVNFTITVEAGMELAELKKIIEAKKQYLPLTGAGTVGGAVSTRQENLRDHVLGMGIVLASGERVRVGAKVMKNVAGYDIAKLLYGAWGTLGVIVDVTFRLWPAPFEPSPQGTPSLQEFAHPDLTRIVKNAFDPSGLLNRDIYDRATAVTAR